MSMFNHVVEAGGTVLVLSASSAAHGLLSFKMWLHHLSDCFLNCAHPRFCLFVLDHSCLLLVSSPSWRKKHRFNFYFSPLRRPAVLQYNKL